MTRAQAGARHYFGSWFKHWHPEHPGKRAWQQAQGFGRECCTASTGFCGIWGAAQGAGAPKKARGIRGTAQEEHRTAQQRAGQGAVGGHAHVCQQGSVASERTIRAGWCGLDSPAAACWTAACKRWAASANSAPCTCTQHALLACRISAVLCDDYGNH